MEIDYLQALNKPQRKAVENTEGPVMIIAGAGSGKTRVLTYRIAHLIHLGVDAFQVLALTFTNKASREMRERIQKIVGSESKNLWMGTFHSVFARILRAEADKLGYPNNFSIYDTVDSKNLIKSIIREQGLDDKLYKPNTVFNRISHAKNNLIGPETYAQDPELTNRDKASGKPKIAELYKIYALRCFKAGAMDFDDLLYKTYVLFKTYEDVLYKYQHRFKYILVDEFQDTNFAQYQIVKALAIAYENICVVGDDAQSIYAFRGANIQNILNFEKDYPDLKTYKLEQNYRSTEIIVSAASNVIANNKHQIPKKIWTQNQEGARIRVLRAASDTDEGRTIAKDILEEKLQNQLLNQDFAILYRTNAQSRAFEEALRKLNIPYRVYGGTSFYQRKEVKDLVAYLRMTVNPYDEEALKRIINYPTRGIGKRSLEKMLVLADEKDVPLWDVVSNIEDLNFGASGKKIDAFATMIKSFMALAKKQNAYDLAKHIAKHTRIQQELYNDKSVEGVSRYENLEELLNSINAFAEREDVEDKSLGEFLQSIALLTSQDTDDDDNDKVSLMTVHSAKGLEFPQIFVVGMEENLFPSQLSLNSRKDLEEERRLFYVAVTRAKQKLHISYALSRWRHGSLFHCEPSRFIDELGEQYLQIEGGRKSQFGKAFDFEENMSGRFSNGGSSNQSGLSPSSFKNKNKNVPLQNPNFKADSLLEVQKNIQVGKQVEHSRFGTGKVLKQDGKGDKMKVTIFFPGFGQKDIMVKYAKLRVI